MSRALYIVGGALALSLCAVAVSIIYHSQRSQPVIVQVPRPIVVSSAEPAVGKIGPVHGYTAGSDIDRLRRDAYAEAQRRGVTLADDREAVLLLMGKPPRTWGEDLEYRNEYGTTWLFDFAKNDQGLLLGVVVR